MYLLGAKYYSTPQSGLKYAGIRTPQARHGLATPDVCRKYSICEQPSYRKKSPRRSECTRSFGYQGLGKTLPTHSHRSTRSHCCMRLAS